MSTSSVAVPQGYQKLETPEATALVAPEALEWTRQALQGNGTLYGAGAPLRSEGPHRLGRGAIRAVLSENGAPRWVIRHCRRGGALRSVLKDRYPRIGIHRPFLEVEASRRLRDGGVRTPAVMAAAVYPSGPFYRGDLMTDYATGDQLIQVLREPNKAELHNRALKGVSRAITRLASLGAYHVDLNATNLLVDADLDAAPWVLDLDRMRFGTPKGEATQAMTARLLRSLAKLECSPAVLELAHALLPSSKGRE